VSDYLGISTHAFDEQGALVWERELDCYGKVRKETGIKGLVPHLYQGQYYDEDCSLAYNRFRYYDPESGNYISQDKLGLIGNNPTSYGYVIDTNLYVDFVGLNPEYYPLDNLGRPTGGFVEVTNSTLGTGTDAGSYNPKGWEGGEHPYHQQRGHLVSNNHGGSGTDPRNIVTITDGTNHPGMTRHENAITNHAKKGNTVLVEVKAHYNGDELIPSHISIYAIDQNGKVIADASVPNGQRQRTKCCMNSH
jgi:RHS repeat-associated protein